MRENANRIRIHRSTRFFRGLCVRREFHSCASGLDRLAGPLFRPPMGMEGSDLRLAEPSGLPTTSKDAALLVVSALPTCRQSLGRDEIVLCAERKTLGSEAKRKFLDDVGAVDAWGDIHGMKCKLPRDEIPFLPSKRQADMTVKSSPRRPNDCVESEGNRRGNCSRGERTDSKQRGRTSRYVRRSAHLHYSVLRNPEVPVAVLVRCKPASNDTSHPV